MRSVFIQWNRPKGIPIESQNGINTVRMFSIKLCIVWNEKRREKKKKNEQTNKKTWVDDNIIVRVHR